jgi:hypothetical protein
MKFVVTFLILLAILSAAQANVVKSKDQNPFLKKVSPFKRHK